MCLQYTVWGAVPILCDTLATGAKRLTWVSISCSIFNVEAITIVPVFLQQCIKFCIIFFVVFHLSIDVILEVHVY